MIVGRRVVKLGTQPKGRDVKLVQQMGSGLFPPDDSFKAPPEQVVRPGEVMSVWEEGDVQSKGQRQEG